MLRRVVTKEARVRQIVQGGMGSGPDGSVRMAIKGLQAQIQALRAELNEAILGIGREYTPAGVQDTAGRASAASLRLVNRSGTGVCRGAVVVRHTVEENSFALTERHGDLDAIGVVATVAPGEGDDVGEGEEGLICVEGEAWAVVDADVREIVVGAGLVTHTTAGLAVAASSPEDPAIFATALEPLASGVGRIKVFVRAGALSAAPAVRALMDFDRSLFERDGCFEVVYDEDGSATGFSGFVTSAFVWTDTGKSVPMGHWTYGYGPEGMMSVGVHSVYAGDGSGLCSIMRLFEYQDGRIKRIISELA